MARDNFSKVTIRKLAQRAGYTCSICNRLTVGPSSESDESVNLTGIAAHISGASEGPGSIRYRKMPSEQRKHINNGIWLCATHADYIDGDEVDFTEEKLKEIKEKHENRVKFQHQGINIENGLFIGIEIDNLAKFLKTTSIEFSQNNLILGRTGTGKTILCELIASLKDKSFLERWIQYKNEGNSYVKIKYFRSEAITYQISFDHKRNISYKLNESNIPVLLPPSNIFFLGQSFTDFIKEYDEKEEDAKLSTYFFKYFNLTEIEFLNFITQISTSKKYYVSDFIFDTEEDAFAIKMDSKRRFQSFNSLSSGEQYRVVIEMGLQLAIFYSKFNSTTLIIDQAAFPSMDIAGYNHLIDIVCDNNFDFQFFLTSSYQKHEINWAKLNSYELIEENESIKVKPLTKNIRHLADSTKNEDISNK